MPVKIFKTKLIVLITLTVFLFTALLSGCSTIKSLIKDNISKPPDAVTETTAKNEVAAESGTTIKSEAAGESETAIETETTQKKGEAATVSYYDSDGEFVLGYPDLNVTFSTSPWLVANNESMVLSIRKIKIDNISSQTLGYDKETALKDENELAKGGFGEEIDFPFKASEKVLQIGDNFVKDFLVFNRGSDCDVTFERELIFYKNDYQFIINLRGQTDQIKKSMPDYFKVDSNNCGSEPIWRLEKLGDFYNTLTGKSASRPTLQWFDSSESIIKSMDFKSVEEVSNGNLIVLSKNISEKDTKKNIIIDENYPQFRGTGDDKTEKLLNDNLFGIVDKEVQAFKKDVGSMDTMATTSEEKELLNYVNELQTDFSIPLLSSKYASILFSYYSFTGGAHGNTTTSSYNYDFENKKKIELKDLFAENYNYLKFISDYCIEDIRKQNEDQGYTPDMNWISGGASPDQANFKTFLITENSLIILFDPYQVAPYAWGIVAVNIPFSKFKENMSAGFEVAF